MRLRIIITVIVALTISLLFIDYSTLFTNCWSTLVEPAYIIPAESSVITFRPTVMNEGSGDWWIYGEDEANCYYFIGGESRPYVYVSKKIITAADFNTHDYRTWNLDDDILRLINRNR